MWQETPPAAFRTVVARGSTYDLCHCSRAVEWVADRGTVAQRENLPVISDDHLDAIRDVAKPIPDENWRAKLLTTRLEGNYRKGSYGLRDGIEFGPVRGTLFLFVRWVIAHPQNFSAGLGFQDLAGNGPYRVVRCNGYHPGPHINRLESTVIPPETRHVHFTTERYIKASAPWHDGFAVETDEFKDLQGAVQHLATLTNLVPEGRMFL